MGKVFMIGDTLYDWYTGATIGHSALYEGEVEVFGFGWYKTWLVDGEQAWEHIGKPTEYHVVRRRLKQFKYEYTATVVKE